MLSPATQALFTRTEPLALKHVSQPIATYRYAVAEEAATEPAAASDR